MDKQDVQETARSMVDFCQELARHGKAVEVRGKQVSGTVLPAVFSALLAGFLYDKNSLWA